MVTKYELAARAAGFTVQTFGKKGNSVQKIVRTAKDGSYCVNERGWRYACEDSNTVVPDTLPPEVIALMTEIKSHLTSAQQLMQTLETRLNTLETVP
ncbi:hypothetical protein UFOVP785_86 [uncultured Caudovirales phage]|uniref:Uncharacterized protein n=1 Tax=uncultured Caudovirales phage TaxID=2100421 RepID=A0A6J5NTE5_9CAUD|nr:hypothetical protein UFOVP785_86 [uncultured Caudovirales phage]